MCKYLIVIKQGNSVITKCPIKKNCNSFFFSRIRDVYNDLHPKVNVVYNSECPFYRTKDEEKCPFYEK